MTPTSVPPGDQLLVVARFEGEPEPRHFSFKSLKRFEDRPAVVEKDPRPERPLGTGHPGAVPICATRHREDVGRHDSRQSRGNRVREVTRERKLGIVKTRSDCQDLCPQGLPEGSAPLDSVGRRLVGGGQDTYPTFKQVGPGVFHPLVLRSRDRVAPHELTPGSWIGFDLGDDPTFGAADVGDEYRLRPNSTRLENQGNDCRHGGADHDQIRLSGDFVETGRSLVDRSTGHRLIESLRVEVNPDNPPRRVAGPNRQADRATDQTLAHDRHRLQTFQDTATLPEPDAPNRGQANDLTEIRPICLGPCPGKISMSSPDPSDPESGPIIDPESDAEHEVLQTEAGQQLLALVATVDRPGPSEITRWRTMAKPSLVAAAIRLTDSRRRGHAKFRLSDQMWFSGRGLEQATAEPVAEHKARRFATLNFEGVVVDLCAGIGGDSIALARIHEVVAVDLDPAMALRASWNAKVHGLTDRVRTVTSSAEQFPVDRQTLIHVDPDRRVGSLRKTNSVADYVPGLDTLRGWVKSVRGGSIKLGPASDFVTWFGGEGFEVEIVSLRGECKEASIWFGALAGSGVRRRATVLPSRESWSNRDGDWLAPTLPSGPLDRWVFDPDPALIRSGLCDGFARANGWLRIEPGIDLFTGSERSSSSLVASFEVVDVFPIDQKIIRREVARRGLGPLEIKTRGLATTPETYRTQFRPSGSIPATWILVAGDGGPGRAILTRRPRSKAESGAIFS